MPIPLLSLDDLIALSLHLKQPACTRRITKLDFLKKYYCEDIYILYVAPFGKIATNYWYLTPREHVH